MKYLICLLMAISMLAGSSVSANDVFVGPALRVDSADTCFVSTGSWEYSGVADIQFSNGRTGHATYKCKLELQYGDPQLLTFEGDTDDFPLSRAGYPGGLCYTHIELKGETGMWTSQCFSVWESGD